MSPTPKVQHITAPLDAVQRGIGGGVLFALQALQDIARRESIPVYLVGGPVRDVLMGMPIRDLDFTVEGDALSLARRLAERLDGRAVVHPAFGTASVELPDGRVDLVTARREVYPSPAALPQVTPSSIDDDLARRDFTVNAMAISLNQESAQVIDPHGGIDDLRDGLIRVLHQGSFVDDPTRIFRAVRYEQRLGFRIEVRTMDWLESSLDARHVHEVSGDRLRHELERMFEEELPAQVLRRAAGLGILQAILPGLADVTAVERLTDLAAGPAQPMGYLAALVYPLSPMDGEEVIQRLNMPNSWAEVVRDTIALKQMEPQLSVGSMAGSQLVGLVEEFCEVATLTVSRLTDSQTVAQRLSRYLDQLSQCSPSLDGRDLLALGVPEGPRVGRLLRSLRDAKLDGRLDTEEDERRFVRESLAEQGNASHG